MLKELLISRENDKTCKYTCLVRFHKIKINESITSSSKIIILCLFLTSKGMIHSKIEGNTASDSEKLET